MAWVQPNSRDNFHEKRETVIREDEERLMGDSKEESAYESIGSTLDLVLS